MAAEEASRPWCFVVTENTEIASCMYFVYQNLFEIFVLFESGQILVEPYACILCIRIYLKLVGLLGIWLFQVNTSVLA